MYPIKPALSNRRTRDAADPDLDPELEDEEDNEDYMAEILPFSRIPRTLPNPNEYASKINQAIFLNRANNRSNNISFRRRRSSFSRASVPAGAESEDDPFNISSLFARENADQEDSGYRVNLVTRPYVDNQDRLWGELASLEEVKRAAEDINIYRGFPEGLEEKLKNLRQMHSKLLLLLRERNAKLEEQKRHDIAASAHANSVNQNAGATIFDDGNNTNRGVTGRQATKNASYRQRKMEPIVGTEETAFIKELVNKVKELK